MLGAGDKIYRWRWQSGGLKSFRKWVKCRASICQIFRLCLTLFWCSVPLFPSSLSSTITLGLLVPHFGSLTIFFTCRSTSTIWPLLHYRSRTCTIFRLPPGQTSTTWLVVWGQDHRNHAHAIKVWRIYIHTYIHTNANWLCCMNSSLALRRSAIIFCKGLV